MNSSINVISTIIFAFLCSFNLSSQNTALPKVIRTIEGVKEYKLDNGLKILLIEDATQTNFVVNIIYHVGSRHEGYGETGMAHLLEHMLFKSCKNFTDIKKAIADRGADANGTTYYDRTNYYEIMPASDENLKWAIEMEADRMINAKVLKEELDKEFSVVRNEFEIGENYPSGVLNERILSTMYLWHNYGNSTIGSREDIERVPIENLRAFYRKYYQPDNATLVIAGKFDSNKALEYIVKNLGAIPRPSRVLQPTYTVEPPQDGERYVELKRNGDEKIIAMAYHTPSLADKDYIVNDALIEILTSEGSGILYKELVDKKLATSVYGYAIPLHDPGFAYFSMNIPMDKSTDDAKQAMFNVMNGIDKMTFTQEQLDRAKTALRKQVDKAMSNTINYAVFLTEIIACGDYRLFYIYRDNIDKLTIADLERVAKRYYKMSNRTWGQFIPEKNVDRVKVDERPNVDAMVANYQGIKQDIKTEQFDATIPNIKKKMEVGVIQNKMKYSILNKPTKNEKVEGRIKLFIGDEASLMNKGAVQNICAAMLKAGTTSKSRTQIKDELDKLKSDIDISASSNFISISVKSDKQNLNATLVLLKDLLRNPAFAQNEFEKIILENKTMLESYKNEPQVISFIQVANKTSGYPKGHPYYEEPIDEQISSIEKVTLNDVKNFYHSFIGLNESYVSFVGEYDRQVILKNLDEIFRDWNAKIAYKKIPKKYTESQQNIESIQIDDKTNAVLAGKMNLPISQSNPEFTSLYMVNELLGGGSFLNSRIPQRLREAEGMSYGAGTYLDAEWDEPVAALGSYAFFNPSFKDKLNSAFLDEMTKASQGTFNQKELDDLKKSQVQERRMRLGNNGFLTSMFNRYSENAIALDYYDQFSDQLQKLSLQQVNETAKKYLNLKKLYMVYSGDFKIK